ncbi:MAG TPA: hypothetical protein VKD90_28430 [Gemmataceae bacterium]|nr:hypothetical protein [Gemmataceae bacterium]
MDQAVRPAAARRQPARRARRSVLSTLVTLAVLNVGLALWVHARPSLRDALYYPKENLLAEQFARPAAPTRVTIVALGSSRTGNAFHPPTVEAEVTAATGRPCLAFNMSLPGSAALTQLLHLRRLLARGIRPDVVVVEVTPAMSAVPETFFLRPDRVSRDELDMLTEVGFADDQYRADWWETMLNPWFGLRFQLLARIQPKWMPPGVPRVVRELADPTGWTPWREVITPEVYRTRLALARHEHYPTLQKMEGPGEVPRRALLEIFAICKREGITAVAVLPPEGSEFRSWYGPGARRAAAELLALARDATGGRAVDSREWLPDSEFVDGHHVHESAAPGFTSRLTREALIPAVQKEPGGPALAGRGPDRTGNHP